MRGREREREAKFPASYLMREEERLIDEICEMVVVSMRRYYKGTKTIPDHALRDIIHFTET